MCPFGESFGGHAETVFVTYRDENRYGLRIHLQRDLSNQSQISLEVLQGLTATKDAVREAPPAAHDRSDNHEIHP